MRETNKKPNDTKKPKTKKPDYVKIPKEDMDRWNPGGEGIIPPTKNRIKKGK